MALDFKHLDLLKNEKVNETKFPKEIKAKISGYKLQRAKFEKSGDENAEAIASRLSDEIAEMLTNWRTTEEYADLLDGGAKKKAEEDARISALAEKKAQEKLDAENKKKAEKDASDAAATEAKKKADEEAAGLVAAEAKKKADEEAAALANTEAKKKADEEAAALANTEAKKKADEEAAAIAEAEAKKKAEEEAETKRQEEATAFKKKTANPALDMFFGD